ncbi:MAG TPA: F0F1 ATP synthase subunit delta [Pilimelia sp.]|nr:F0F1 ATP synthase subunit delta [Pilimelia sp.]
METASRESYAAVAQRLAAYADGTEPEELIGTADEILAVAGLLLREPRLRRALSDPARSGEDRAALLRELLGDQVGEATRDLLAALVAGRWSTGSELLNAVERLGVDTLLAAADRAGDLADVEDELFRFGQIVEGTPELAVLVGDPAVAPERRVELVRTLLDGKARPVTVRLAELAVRGFGGRNFVASLSRLVDLAADRQARQVAYVIVAGPLSEDEERRLGAKLSELYGREVSMKLTVDPEILGGISVQVGSDLYDGTVARRLADVRYALVRR